MDYKKKIENLINENVKWWIFSGSKKKKMGLIKALYILSANIKKAP